MGLVKMAPSPMVEGTDDDAASVAALRRGDTQAFGRLIERHQASVARFCLRYTGSAALSRDLTQDVFLTLWDERARYRHQGRLRAYLLTIARFRCLAHAKKHGRLVPYDLDEREGVSGSEGGLLRAQLLRSLRRLEPDFAEVVVLRYLEELELQEIAELVGVPLGTVKSRLHRALAQLRKEWQ